MAWGFLWTSSQSRTERETRLEQEQQQQEQERAREEKIGNLTERIKQLKKEQEFRARLRYRGVLLGAAIIIASGTISLIMTAWEPAAIGGAYGLILFVGVLAIPSSREASFDMQSARDEIEFLSAEEHSIEMKAYRLFRLHQVEVKRYYSQALSHGNVLFNIGLACILLGLAIVVFSLVALTTSSNPSSVSKFVIGGVGVLGGILSNFVAAIYLRMYTKGIESLNSLHNRLVSTHFLHFSDFLTAKVSNGNLREETLCEIAKSLTETAAFQAEGGEIAVRGIRGDRDSTTESSHRKT